MTSHREVLFLPEKWEAFWNASVTKTCTFANNLSSICLSQDQPCSQLFLPNFSLKTKLCWGCRQRWWGCWLVSSLTEVKLIEQTQEAAGMKHLYMWQIPVRSWQKLWIVPWETNGFLRWLKRNCDTLCRKLKGSLGTLCSYTALQGQQRSENLISDTILGWECLRNSVRNKRSWTWM